jgi:hypothetical protein
MRILNALAKRLFSLRKIVWLFLCGMLLVSGKSGAQQPDRELVVKYGPYPSLSDKVPAPVERPHKIEPVVKYGPRRPLPGLPNGPGQKGAAGEEQGAKGKAGAGVKGEQDPSVR